jgi:hypothetical protein
MTALANRYFVRFLFFVEKLRGYSYTTTLKVLNGVEETLKKCTLHTYINFSLTAKFICIRQQTF